jgi:hypothetical protein
MFYEMLGTSVKGKIHDSLRSCVFWVCIPETQPWLSQFAILPLRRHRSSDFGSQGDSILFGEDKTCWETKTPLIHDD